MKPSNVLLHRAGDRDVAYLVDFGVVRALDGSAGTSLTATGVTVGTLLYMAPELLTSDHDADRLSDVYALGCVLVEALTGRAPLDVTGIPSLMYHHVSVPPPRPSDRGADPAFDEVVARAMAEDPQQRHASAGELAAHARRALAPRPPVVVGRTVPLDREREDAPAVPRASPHRARAVGGAAASVLAIVVAAVVALSTSSSPSAGAGGTTPSAGPTTIGTGGARFTVPTTGTIIATEATVGDTTGVRTQASLTAPPATGFADGTYGNLCGVVGDAVAAAGSRRPSTTWFRLTTYPEYDPSSVEVPADVVGFVPAALVSPGAAIDATPSVVRRCDGDGFVPL